MRRKKEIKITSGRDSGKTFLIEEKSALEVEKFCVKLLLAVGKNKNVGGLIASHGSLTVLENPDAILSLIFSISEDEANSLMEEMLSCVSFVYSINKKSSSRPLIPEDIEDMSTLFKLRKEVIALHGNFTIPEEE